MPYLNCVLDATTGHGCYRPLVNLWDAAPNVTIGGRNPSCVGGIIGAHCGCRGDACHIENVVAPIPTITFPCGVASFVLAPTSMGDVQIFTTWSPVRFGA